MILVRVYEGYKIKKDILHPFIPHTSLLKLYKIGKQDAKILRKHVHVLKGLQWVQWDRARFVGRGVSKRAGSNPVHGPSVGWASLLGVTVP